MSSAPHIQVQQAERQLRKLQLATLTLPGPEPEFEQAFRAYTNYLEDLAGLIGGHFGLAESLVEGVIRSTEANPGLRRVSRRRLDPRRRSELDSALRKAWGHLRRLQGELDDPGFDGEANASLPQGAYNAIYHSLLALAVASGQPIPRDHRSALNMISKEVRRGLLLYPWSAYAEGCPQTGGVRFGGVSVAASVHVLSKPDPASAEDRLGMLLRTTRAKELEQRFTLERSQRVAPGRDYRRLSASEKERIADRLAATTLFDVFWRLRKKASYEDADVFVLGADGLRSSRRFAEALVLVTNATVAAIEVIVAAYVGPEPLSQIAQGYLRRIRSERDIPVQRRVVAWRRREIAARGMAQGPRS